MTSTDQLAERVRKAVEASFHVPADSIYVFSHDDYDAAMDSLPALLAALEAAEQQRDELLADAAGQDERDRNAAGQFLAQMDMLRAAEARAKRAEQERDQEADWRAHYQIGEAVQRERVEAAEARAVSFEKALRELATNVLNFCENEVPPEWDGGSVGYEVGGLAAIATDALSLLAASVPQDGEQA